MIVRFLFISSIKALFARIFASFPLSISNAIPQCWLPFLSSNHMLSHFINLSFHQLIWHNKRPNPCACQLKSNKPSKKSGTLIPILEQFRTTDDKNHKSESYWRKNENFTKYSKNMKTVHDTVQLCSINLILKEEVGKDFWLLSGLYKLNRQNIQPNKSSPKHVRIDNLKCKKCIIGLYATKSLRRLDFFPPLYSPFLS